MFFEITPRMWRLTKLTLVYLGAIIAAILIAGLTIYAIAVYFTPLALVGLLVLALLATPAYFLALGKLTKLEEIEQRVERELRRSN